LLDNIPNEQKKRNTGVTRIDFMKLHPISIRISKAIDFLSSPTAGLYCRYFKRKNAILVLNQR
jgi:hypothetical protein